jgi:hypothetical protein
MFTNKTKIVSFQIVSFDEPETKKPIIIPYALGDNGLMYEYTNRAWTQLPEINLDKVKKMP